MLLPPIFNSIALQSMTTKSVTNCIEAIGFYREYDVIIAAPIKAMQILNYTIFWTTVV